MIDTEEKYDTFAEMILDLIEANEDNVSPLLVAHVLINFGVDIALSSASTVENGNEIAIKLFDQAMGLSLEARLKKDGNDG